MSPYKHLYQTVVVLKLMLLRLGLSEIVHSQQECFTLPAVYEEEDAHYDYPSPPSYKYYVKDMPDVVNITLSCPDNSTSVSIKDVIYSLPSTMDDYCMDKDTECTSKIQPCQCCTKPPVGDNTTMCYNQPSSTVICMSSGDPSTCTVVVPVVYFTQEMCTQLSIQCQGPNKDYCKSRWVDINYMCTSLGPPVPPTPEPPVGITMKGIVTAVLVPLVIIALVVTGVVIICVVRNRSTSSTAV